MIMPIKRVSGHQIQPIPAGLYQFDFVNHNSKSRVHLRLDEDNSGLLIVNASRVVHLNPTAAQMAYYHLNKVDQKKAVGELKARFRATEKQIEQDYQETIQQVDALIDEESGLCPVCDLGLEAEMPFSAKLSAPYRMDLALTYRCNNNCAHCYNARPRNYPEVKTNVWKAVIDKIWDLRIPHVVFTGGEPTLREDLVELVAYAQEKGLVTGLNTNARRLADKSLVDSLVQAGLDHVQITVESYSPAIHDEMVQASGAWWETIAGLRNVVQSKLYMMTNTTLLQNNAWELEKILTFLAQERVPTVGLNALIYSGHGKTVQTGLKEQELPKFLELATSLTQKNGQRLIWYTPTQYCQFNPTQLSLGVKGCTAAYYNMCIEPDGQVIPCQSYYHSLGHILEDNWDSIWNHRLSKQLRERQDIPAGCEHCDFLQECGGGCPLARDHQSVSPIFVDLL
ncbi:MAG: radical SAM protein [Anaerolineaceae bacterium]